MKLKDKVRILMDDDKIKEVDGNFFPYEYNGHSFQLIVHESEQPWTPNLLDISEVTTGCRCTSTDKTVASSTKEDVIEAMDKFIKDKGLRNLQAEIKKRKLRLDKIK